MSLTVGCMMSTISEARPLGGTAKKKRYFLGIFPKWRTPPTPPFWEFRKNFTVFFGQVENFWVILRCLKGVFMAMVITQKVLGNGVTPPLLGKIPKKYRFFFLEDPPYPCPL